MRILIIGSRGNLGQDLVSAFGTVGHDVTGLDRGELDILDEEAVRTAARAAAYDAIINAAAYNDVDGAEKEENDTLAWALNATLPAVLAEEAKKSRAKFVHYSTDYVFAGDNPDGYAEDDTPAPLSKYGATKAAGEDLVRKAGGFSFVVHLSKIFGRPGSSPHSKPSFAAMMLKLAAEKPELAIVDEEFGMPSYTPDIADATLHLLTGGFTPGTYHVVNEGPPVTWYGFAEELFSAAGVTTPRRPVPAAEFAKPGAAARPKYAPLKNTKFPKLRSRAAAIRDFLSAR